MNKDLTTGKPETVLWRFCLPLFGSVLFQQLYNIADSLVAGKFLGENALAAVGNSYEITLIFIAVAFGCNIGCSVIVARLYGSKSYREMKTAVYTTMLVSAVLCAVLILFGILCGEMLLRLIHTQDEILADSRRYLVAFFIEKPSELALSSGMQFLFVVAPFYFVVSLKLAADGVLRGAGLMKKFMAATFTDLVLRVVLAILLAERVGYIGIWCAWPIGWSVAMVMSVVFYRKQFGKSA